MDWFGPFVGWWEGVRENPKPWWVVGAGLAMPFLNLTCLSGPVFWCVMILGFVLCELAPFLSRGSLARRIYLAALAYLTCVFASTVAYMIGMSGF